MLVAAPAAADERDDATPTGWWHLYGVTEAQITNLINSNGARLVDLEAQEGTNPQTFTATFVPNSGVHAVSGWWWYYGVTVADIVDFLNTNQARLIDLRRYTVGGVDRFTCVMVRNTGPDAKAWWWYVGQTSAQVTNLINTNNGRLVSLSSFVSGGTRFFDVVMISNTGADASGWWWYFNVTGDQVTGFLNANQARLYDWEVFTDGAGVRRFNVVMLPNTGAAGVYWWWYYDTSLASLVSLVSQNGARIFDIESYDTPSGHRYGALMINNSNALTTRIGTILQYGADGATGCYLKRVGGGVLASLQPGFVFEPASTIKGLIALHFMRDVEAGNRTMGGLHQVFLAASGSCPVDLNPTFESNRVSLFKMLKNSDNNRTQAFVADLGEGAINLTASNVVGMLNSGIHHRLGCGNEAVLEPNELTLADAGLMYEKIFDTTVLGATWRDSLRTYLVNEINFFPVQTQLEDIVDEEAALQGLPASAATFYKSQIRYAFKAGSYGLFCSPCEYFYSVAGWVQIPRCGRGLDRQFVFGTFVHNAVNEASASDRMWTAAAELFREEVRDGLSSCPLGIDDLPVSGLEVALSAPHPNPARGSAQLRFTLPTAAETRLTVHDLAGREVARLAEGPRAAGDHLVTWDTASVTPGVYFLRLSAGGRASSRRMVVIR